MDGISRREKYFYGLSWAFVGKYAVCNGIVEHEPKVSN